MTLANAKARKAKAVAKVGATAASAMAAYATYERTAGFANRVAQNHFSTWRIDEYDGALVGPARRFVKTHAVGFAGPQAIMDRRNDVSQVVGDLFSNYKWTWIKAPGLPLIQARFASGDLHLRSPQAAWMRTWRDHLVALADDFEANDDGGFDLDFGADRHRLDVLAWDSATAHWVARSSRQARSFDSVVLPADLQAEIENDLERFTESRVRLNRLEVPWRRGYLLYGPPGTGKTSLSLSVAGALRFNLATLTLNSIKDDDELAKAISSLNSRTVLVIEDIDAYSVSQNRDHNIVRDGGLSLSGMLNAFDGFTTPDGLVTIATTNHPDKLDPALTRSGRFDRQFELGFIAGPELERLFLWFYEAKPPSRAPSDTALANVVPAEIAELFKQHLDDPASGWEAACRLVRNKVLAASAVRLEAVA